MPRSYYNRRENNKQKTNTETRDLNSYMYSLGDGKTADQVRLEIIKGIVRYVLEDSTTCNALIENVFCNKNMVAVGFGYKIGDTAQEFDRINFGAIKGCDVPTMLATFLEFLNHPDARLRPSILFNDTSPKTAFSKGWGWVGSKGTVAITWFSSDNSQDAVTCIGVMANETVVPVNNEDDLTQYLENIKALHRQKCA